MSTVTIVIPTFNESKNIGRLLASIKKQSYKDIEIIVVDDGSTDTTVNIAKKYTRHVFKRKHAERSIQRNFGAERAKGKYLLFLDADMELTKNVIGSCVNSINGHKALIVPEKTVGRSFIAEIRRFERGMYLGDPTIEVARFFDKNTFFEFKGYDPSLTGTEDYDLPYRISQKYSIGYSKDYVLHHEEDLTLGRLLSKKYYYAKHGSSYAKKHPELIWSQGTIILRKAYLQNWRKFLKNPVYGFLFLLIRLLETLWAVAGYMSAVGIFGFIKTIFRMLKYL